ncbi:LLM class flavin-dependent oxidoreductase [Mycolicibacterium sp.]|uniref:LLM class flavin-dependent oxidoreductase n=1 Tax=Mycolicibacterium sp. TaxID=2320850 RepID=UPI0037CC9CD5
MAFKFFLMFNPFGWETISEPIKMAGRRTDRYQHALDQLVLHAKVADEAGFEGVFFSEQHGNIEGIPEVTANPILMDMFVAAHTEHLKVGQLGMTLPVSNPLLIADQIAHLDQLTKGRAMAGFARGNTPRWADQYGQHIPMRATRSDKSEEDERNLRALKECWQIIKLAWTQDSFSFDGEFWKFPLPGTKWTYPHTKTWGTGVDAEENLLGVSIAPGPMQSPHPRVFAPMSGRSDTVRFWAREGATIMCLTPREDLIAGMLNVYAEAASDAGRNPVRGEGIITGGTFVVADDERTVRARAEAMAEWDTMVYSVPPYNLPHPLTLNGTPQQIIDQIGRIHDSLGLTEFVLTDYFPAPHGSGVALEMLQCFAEEVLPAFVVKPPNAGNGSGVARTEQFVGAGDARQP